MKTLKCAHKRVAGFVLAAVLMGTALVFPCAATGDIGLDKAKEIALTHAGLKADAVTYVKTELDYDDGIAEYDVEFVSGETKYEYDIDVTDGSVRQFSQRKIDKNATAAAPAGSVTLAQAKTAALTHAGFTADKVTFTKAKLDFDDGIAEYDVEFIAGNTKYEYEIKAADGSVQQYSQQAVDNTSTTAGATGDIGLDKAKAAALTHAGFTADKVTFTKTKLDYDDGVAEYEIEFVTGGKEYEYSINVANGSIIEFDVERID